MKRRTYGEYLNSPHWKKTRAEARRRAKGRCRVCGTPASLETHHKTYKHLGRERQSELVVLCADHHGACHEFIAMWQKGIRERGWKTRSTYSITMKFVARERAKLRRKKVVAKST